jgi:hypothetical protein
MGGGESLGVAFAKSQCFPASSASRGSKPATTCGVANLTRVTPLPIAATSPAPSDSGTTPTFVGPRPPPLSHQVAVFERARAHLHQNVVWARLRIRTRSQYDTVDAAKAINVRLPSARVAVPAATRPVSLRFVRLRIDPDQSVRRRLRQSHTPTRIVKRTSAVPRRVAIIQGHPNPGGNGWLMRHLVVN